MSLSLPTPFLSLCKISKHILMCPCRTYYWGTLPILLKLGMAQDLLQPDTRQQKRDMSLLGNSPPPGCALHGGGNVNLFSDEDDDP